MAQPRRHRASRGRAQSGSKTNPNSAASCSASALELSALLPNSLDAGGGPLSNNSRGGGRRISMFRTRVARENMT
eukprot:4460392-Pyramimonas_sp.AAC.1